jgi:peptidoglycan/xylan/chitin deacetylase (PgdA/CDA1 family)
MRIFPAKTPKFVKSLFPQFVWQVPTDKKELYLTFDDGPTPAVTPWVVDCLNSYEAKATFFCIGKNIEQHPDIFDAVINAGHSVGNHTQHHLKGWKTSTKVYVENVIQAQRYFKDETVSPENCLSNVISKAAKGSIVVMHDSEKASENLYYALPKILDYFSREGYEFKALNTKRIPE